MPETPSSPVGATAEADYLQAHECIARDDLEGAVRWLERATAGMHPAAMTELASLDIRGLLPFVDTARATELLLEAEARGGTPETSYLLAQVAIGGVGLARDPQRIDTWLADSAQRGYPAALRAAGVIFGQRVEEEFQRAATVCLQRASEAGDPIATALFADRLHLGCGVPADAARAIALAAPLREAGIPVELPMARAGVDTTPSFPDMEPPWTELHSFHSGVPSSQPLCKGPEAATFERLLNDEECRYLIYSGSRFLRHSMILDADAGRTLAGQMRSSQDSCFDMDRDEPVIRLLQLRMAQAAGFDLCHCEPLVLLHYGPGDQYLPHRDYFFPSSPSLAEPGGQRHSTVCTYLNNVEKGGETVFLEKKVGVRPQRGRALMFRSLLKDGNPDTRSLHAGLPVTAGEKWLASCWIRHRQHRYH